MPPRKLCGPSLTASTRPVTASHHSPARGKGSEVVGLAAEVEGDQRQTPAVVPAQVAHKIGDSKVIGQKLDVLPTQAGQTLHAWSSRRTISQWRRWVGFSSLARSIGQKVHRAGRIFAKLLARVDHRHTRRADQSNQPHQGFTQSYLQPGVVPSFECGAGRSRESRVPGAPRRGWLCS